MVEHQPQHNRFIISKDAHECLLEYRLQGQDIDFTHTYVPFALRGQGLAEQLVKEGLAWAQAQNYNIAASCSYVHKWL